MGSTIRLVTSVGTRPYPQTRYRWQGATVTSPYPSVALVRLLGLREGLATALLTEEAAGKHWEPLRAALAGVGWAAELRLVPKGATAEEQMVIADEVMDAVKPGEAILLDVTQGLRHLPMVYLAALVYLVGLQGNKLRGIYYAAYDLRDEDPEGTAPIMDLTPIFRLLEWYQALGAARETGDLRPVTRSLSRDRAWLFRQGRGSPEFGRAADAMTRLARALAMGTPLEVGIEARRAVTALQRVRAEHVPWPPARRMLQWLRVGLAEGWWGEPLPATPTGEAGFRKEGVPLTREELSRHLELAQWYADRYDFVRTVLLLREWLVSAAVWAYGDADRWLTPEERGRARSRLHALERQLAQGLVAKDQAILGSLWQRVRRARNALAHGGMGLAEVRWSEPEKIARESLAACREALAGIARPLPWPLPQKGRLVITPLGLKPGPLFTACRRLRPDRLVIVTSPGAGERIDEALAAAGMSEVERRVLLLEDPFTGEGAPEGRLDQEVRSWLASASEVVANVTGGTSFMGYVVQQVALEAQRLGRIVRWCVLIDRRPDDAQWADPYVEGDVRWLGQWGERDEEDGLEGQ